MEEFYNDYELNQKANRIIVMIEKIMAPIVAGGMMMSFNENGLRVAKDLLDNCLPDLIYIKNRINAKDESYITISDTLAVTAAAIIKMPVSSISIMANTNNFHSDKTLARQMKLEIAEATRLMSIISNFDLSARARQKINENLGMLNEAEKRVNPKSNSCYIASCIYGSYNEKEVLILRSFRDNNLNKSLFGRLFISIYYFISPNILKFAGNSNTFNKFMRFFLIIL